MRRLIRFATFSSLILILAMPLAAQAKYRIGFVYPTLNNPFFVDQQAGANKAGEDFGAVVTHVSGNNDVNTQTQLVENYIAQHVDAIVLQAVDTKGIVGAIKEANDAGIPVFCPGETPEGGKVVASAVFDEVQTGAVAADFVIKHAKRNSKIVMLLGIQGTETAQHRQTGFESTIASKAPSLEIIAKQPADFDRAKGLQVMEAILSAQPKIDVVWAANDEMALGAIQAIKEAGREKEMFVVGTDGIADARKAVEAGSLAATYALPPFRQGYMVVETAIKYLQGTQVCDKITERGLLITADNVRNAAANLKAVGPGDRYWEECYK